MVQFVASITDSVTLSVGEVDQVQFVAGMLIALGTELCGEPLTWEADVQPFLERFKVHT